ncbi:glycosyl transferase [Shewanella electrodiphila]|uniref:Glycosyl transferase n=1 Tax=Shewanella electrodiphila TaxID=934143 RepID=A0ABT0KJX4_9GAMM|nr:glycosyl transferase [Shewanella electrodiphila]MCL1044143.1 glycosyl transferase [Shewanella electrodiphila]
MSNSKHEKNLTICLKSEKLLFEALTSKSSLICEDKKLKDKKVIINLTTYSKRIKDVHLVLQSLSEQIVKPDKIILWLDEDEFCNTSIPKVISNFINRGLEVKYTKNIRSYKKIIPALLLYPNDINITVDDDIIYPYNFLEELLMEHVSYSNVIIGHRAHRITTALNGKILPYKRWDIDVLDDVPSHLTFITTGGGTLFPPNCFNPEVFNEEVFMKLAPHADDVWIKCMALFSDVKCKRVNNQRCWDKHFFVLPEGQDISLYLTNLKDNGNDNQLKAIFELYSLNELLR